jgi:hypothetical protein
MKLQDFLNAVYDSYSGDTESFGDVHFWIDQYDLWETGYRGVDLHDQTCKILVNNGQE